MVLTHTMCAARHFFRIYPSPLQYFTQNLFAYQFVVVVFDMFFFLPLFICFNFSSLFSLNRCNKNGMVRTARWKEMERLKANKPKYCGLNWKEWNVCIGIKRQIINRSDRNDRVCNIYITKYQKKNISSEFHRSFDMFDEFGIPIWLGCEGPSETFIDAFHLFIDMKTIFSINYRGARAHTRFRSLSHSSIHPCIPLIGARKSLLKPLQYYKCVIGHVKIKCQFDI